MFYAIVSKGSVIILSHRELLTVRLDNGRNLPKPTPFDPCKIGSEHGFLQFLGLCRLLFKSFMTCWRSDLISAAPCILKPKLSKVIQSGHVFLPLINFPLLHVRSQNWDFQGIFLIKFIKHWGWVHFPPSFSHQTGQGF